MTEQPPGDEAPQPTQGSPLPSTPSPDVWATPPPAPPGPPPPYGAPAYGAPAYGAPPSAPPGTYYDPQSGLALPQGLQLAGVGRRIGAYFLSILLAVVTLGIGYIIWGLIIWPRGQTPAFQVLKMRCWRPQDARVPGFWIMALREIIGRLVDGLVGFITAIISFVLFLSRNEHQALHDLVAGTVVVYDPQGLLSQNPG